MALSVSELTGPSLVQGSNLGKKSTRPQGLLLRIFTGPEDFLQDQNFVRKKKVNTIEQQAFFIP